MQTADMAWPRTTSPGFSASVRYFANFASSWAASSGVSSGGKSLVFTIFAPAAAFPQGPAPAARKIRPAVDALPSIVRSKVLRISSGFRVRFQTRNSLKAPAVPFGAAVQPMRRCSNLRETRLIDRCRLTVRCRAENLRHCGSRRHGPSERPAFFAMIASCTPPPTHTRNFAS